jgi:hypothetical protein
MEFLYPEVVESWERDTSSHHLFEVPPGTKDLHLYHRLREISQDLATSKVLYLVSQETKERYRFKALKDFSLVKQGLLSIRRAKNEKLPNYAIHKSLDTMPLLQEWKK